MYDKCGTDSSTSFYWKLMGVKWTPKKSQSYICAFHNTAYLIMSHIHLQYIYA